MKRSRMNHKDLDAWKVSMMLAKLVFQETKSFPKNEQFGMTSQMRRAAVSVPVNIAEGSARKGDKEFIQFLHIALGSLAELETLTILAADFEYSSDKQKDSLLEQITISSKLVYGMIKYLRNKKE